MKKTAMRVLAILLALFTLCTVFASCNQNKGDQPDGDSGTQGDDLGSSSESEGESETDIYEGLRDMDYGGKKFKILTYEADVEWNPYIMEVEGGTQVLSKAAYVRNTEVEKLLNVTVDTVFANGTAVVEHVYNTSMAEFVDYDLIFSYATNTFAGLLTGNYLYNVKKVGNMNLDQAWYNQSANENFTIKKKQYFFVSDFSLPVQQRFAFLANIDMIDEYKVLEQFEDVNSIYDLVRKGEWTFDNLQLMIKNVNASYAKGDFNGTYGFVTNENSAARFLNNWGEDIVSTEFLPSTGSYRFVYNLNGSVLGSKVERLTSFIHDDVNVYFEPNSDPTNQYGHSMNDPNANFGNDYYDIFKRGDAMFSTYSSDPWKLATGAEYQGMHFAYLPYPKYTDQENYITVTHGGVMMFPLAVVDIDFAGAVTEALSAASHKYMVDAYKTNYFESRVIQDAEGLEMYQLILDTAYYDVARYVDPSKGNNGEMLCASLLYFGFLIRSGNSLDWRFQQHGSTITTAYTDLYAKLPTE